MKITLPQEILVLNNFLKNHTPLYVVGGYVRDFLLGKKSNDIDLCSSLTPKKLSEILKDTPFKIFEVNTQFGTCKILTQTDTKIEYSTLRLDTYDKNGKHSPKKVEFTSSLQLDSNRRDFTVNALYYDISNDKILDFHSGLQDLKNKVLRTPLQPTQTLKSDGERLLRLAKYATLLDFKIDDETLKFAKLFKDNLYDLSKTKIDKFKAYLSQIKAKQKQKIIEILFEINNQFTTQLLKGDNS